MRLLLSFKAMLALLRRYAQVFRHAWSRRAALTPARLKETEAEFLPAALAIQMRPVSALGRSVTGALIVLMLLLLAWSVLGKIDIVANAQGKVIPSDYTKVLASVEVARVSQIHVQEGQRVHKGDLLIELDVSQIESERDKARDEAQLAYVQILRSQALLKGLAQDTPPVIVAPDWVPSEWLHQGRRQLQDIWQDHRAKLERLKLQIGRYEAQLPLVAQRAQDYRALASQRDVSEHAWMEKEQAYLELTGQLNDARMAASNLTLELIRTTQEELLQATKVWSSSRHEEQRARSRIDLLKILAPIDGTVQQLTVHTVGGVVNAVQPLMLIVPTQHPVEFEAFVENRDIGFIHPQQSARIKIDAYDYTKYGALSARVLSVSQDAIDPTGMGASQNLGRDEAAVLDGKRPNENLRYTVRLALDESALNINGVRKPITPGMSGSVEILTGERRVIEFVISPLLRHAQESLHER